MTLGLQVYDTSPTKIKSPELYKYFNEPRMIQIWRKKKQSYFLDGKRKKRFSNNK